MVKYVYKYSGTSVDYWDDKGKTVVSSTASQKDLEYLFGKVQGITQIEEEIKVKK